MSILDLKVSVDGIEYDVEIHEDDLKVDSWVGKSIASAKAYAKKHNLNSYSMNVIMANSDKSSVHYKPMLYIYSELSKIKDSMFN